MLFQTGLVLGVVASERQMSEKRLVPDVLRVETKTNLVALNQPGQALRGLQLKKLRRFAGH